MARGGTGFFAGDSECMSERDRGAVQPYSILYFVFGGYDYEFATGVQYAQLRIGLGVRVAVRKGYAGLCVMHNGFMENMGTDLGAEQRRGDR